MSILCKLGLTGWIVGMIFMFAASLLGLSGFFPVAAGVIVGIGAFLAVAGALFGVLEIVRVIWTS